MKTSSFTKSLIRLWLLFFTFALTTVMCYSTNDCGAYCSSKQSKQVKQPKQHFVKSKYSIRKR